MAQASTQLVDGFDRKILEIVQISNRVTSESIAEKIGLSPAAVQRRIKRMRDKNIIRSDISVVDPDALGRSMTFIVQVSLERERSDLIDAFKNEMKKNTAVQQCYYITGSADFILVVTETDMAGYENFTRETFFGNTNIKSFQTNVVMDVVKAGLSIPLDADEP